LIADVAADPAAVLGDGNAGVEALHETLDLAARTVPRRDLRKSSTAAYGLGYGERSM
jgi:hypothetical protein